MSTQHDLYADIASTRQEVSETVDELVSRFDVKARAQHKAEETKAAVIDKAADVGPRRALLAGGVAVAAVAALVLWRRRR